MFSYRRARGRKNIVPGRARFRKALAGCATAGSEKLACVFSAARIIGKTWCRPDAAKPLSGAGPPIKRIANRRA